MWRILHSHAEKTANEEDAFMGTNVNSRGRGTITGQTCTPEDEFLSCRSVGCHSLPLPSRWWVDNC